MADLPVEVTRPSSETPTKEDVVLRRVEQAKRFGAKAYPKFVEKINACSRTQHIKAIGAFYRHCENKSLEQAETEGTDESVRAFCLELCRESINRDFTQFISTGKGTNFANLVYAALKE